MMGETHAGGECTHSHPRHRERGRDDSTLEIQFPRRSSIRDGVSENEPSQSIGWSIELPVECSRFAYAVGRARLVIDIAASPRFRGKHAQSGYLGWTVLR